MKKVLMNKQALIAVVVAASFIAGCARTGPGDGDEGSETHWLEACENSKECGEGSCICGYCTQRCDVASNCPAPLDACVHDQSHSLFAGCEPGAAVGLCAFASEEFGASASESGLDAAVDSGTTPTSPESAEPVDSPPPPPSPTTDTSDGSAGDDDSPSSELDAATHAPDAEVVGISAEESSRWAWDECGRIPSVAPIPYVTPIFTPDGSGLIVEDGQGQFQKYTLPPDQSPPQPLRPADAPLGVKIALSPDGTLLLEAGSELAVRDLADGSVSVALELPVDCDRESLAMSEDHRFALTSGALGSCVFDVDSGVLLSRLPSADSVAFRDDELVAASCSGDAEDSCQLTVYSLDGSPLTTSELAQPVGGFRAGAWLAAVSPAGDSVATLGTTADGEFSVFVWNTGDASVRWTRAVPDSPEARPIYSPVGDLLLTAEGTHNSDDGTLLASASNTLLSFLGEEPALSPDGLSIATKWSNLLDIATGGSSRLFRTHFQDSEVTDLALSADGTLMVSNAEAVVGWRVAEAFGETQAVWIAGNGGPAIYVAMSPNGDFATISGDRQQMFDARNGVLVLAGQEPTSDLSDICIAFQFNFSSDSRYVAGKRYHSSVFVYDTKTLSLVGGFNTTGCGQGVAFSPDGTLVHTPEGSFSTTDWKPVTPLRELPGSVLPDDTFYDVDVASDGTNLLHTDCPSEDGCRSTLSDTEADLTALDDVGKWTRRHLSSEGHWVVGGGVLVHWPSGSVVHYAEGVTAARFAPNGDIVAGFENGEIARYCRSSLAP
jgi:hypothetical protein